MICYLSSQGSKISYFDENGRETKPIYRKKTRIVLSLENCRILSLNIPPLKGSDRDNLIERNLPALFPLPLDDYRWFSINWGTKALVFLIERRIISKIKEDWGPKAVILSPAQSLPVPEEKNVYSFTSPDGIDLFFCNGDDLDHAIHLKSFADELSLCREFLGEGKKPENFELRTPSGLSHVTKKNPLPLILLVILFSLSPLFLLWQYNRYGSLEAELEHWEKEADEIERNRTNEKPAEDWGQIATLLNGVLPRDKYSQLESLYPFFINRAEIVEITISGENFHIQAEGRYALEILEDLKNVPELEEITLYQNQLQENKESFSLSGRWR